MNYKYEPTKLHNVVQYYTKWTNKQKWDVRLSVHVVQMLNEYPPLKDSDPYYQFSFPYSYKKRRENVSKRKEAQWPSG